MNVAEVLAEARITRRQMEHWIKCGYLWPQGEGGKGHPWWFPEREVTVAVRMGRLTRAGLTASVAAKVARGDARSVGQLRHALEAS